MSGPDPALRLGTRGSLLARTQSQHVADAIAAATGRQVELIIITTRGDQIRDRPLQQVGGKGLFTKEIEDAMLSHEIDLAVHSMKDMPTESPSGLTITAVPERVDPRDALVGATLDELARGAVVGTGSVRRAMQLRALRPDLEIRGIRGNVDTRIRKQRDGDYHAIVLAIAGLTRLRRTGEVAEAFGVSIMIPAVGQGALAVQCRSDDTSSTACSRPSTTHLRRPVWRWSACSSRRCPAGAALRLRVTRASTGTSWWPRPSGPRASTGNSDGWSCGRIPSARPPWAGSWRGAW